MQVYLPDDLYEALKSRGLPASELLQEAVRAELDRRDALDRTDEYLDELASSLRALLFRVGAACHAQPGFPPFLGKRGHGARLPR